MLVGLRGEGILSKGWVEERGLDERYLDRMVKLKDLVLFYIESGCFTCCICAQLQTDTDADTIMHKTCSPGYSALYIASPTGFSMPSCSFQCLYQCFPKPRSQQRARTYLG
jgi:hypothetical protein